MKLTRLLPALFILSLSLGLFPVSGSPRYVPVSGDHFSYKETVDVANGAGYYQGYSDHQDVTGSESINTIYANRTVGSYYQYAWAFRDDSGTTKNGASSGNFSWSSTTLNYVRGNDGQTGYPANATLSVWFYIDNTTQTGGSFYLLDTLMTVQSRNHGFFLPSENRYVNTIFARGSSSYQRNDAYGNYNAAYTWSVYFDPGTGYVVGYVWDERDSNLSGDSFSYTENLSVTSTSYPLATGSGPPSLLEYVLIALAIVIALVVVMVIVVVALSRRRRRVNLPKHAYEQQYRPPQPIAPPSNIDLTPKQPPVQQIVIKEVVKVNCKYCGALIDSSVQTCPICGAPRT